MQIHRQLCRVMVGCDGRHRAVSPHVVFVVHLDQGVFRLDLSLSSGHSPGMRDEKIILSFS